MKLLLIELLFISRTDGERGYKIFQTYILKPKTIEYACKYVSKNIQLCDEKSLNVNKNHLNIIFWLINCKQNLIFLNIKLE